MKDLTKQISVVTKALINGRGTDERLFDLEMKLKYLNSRLIDLAITESTNKSTIVEDVQRIDNEQKFDWCKLNKLLNEKK